MTTGHIFIATSLDGFVARKDGRLDWLMKQKTEAEDHGFDAFMDTVDGIVMGRGSFQQVLSFDKWPYKKPVVVMSRSLRHEDIPPALSSQVRLTSRDPTNTMRMLADNGWHRAYVDGGRLVQSFLRLGLIADITLTRVPILIGDGIPLFGKLDHDIDLEHQSTRTFASGLVTSTYKLVN